jgi:hypothetical protein
VRFEPPAHCAARLREVGTFRIWIAVSAYADMTPTTRNSLPVGPLGGACLSPGSASALVQGSQPMISDLGSPHPRSHFLFFASTRVPRKV